MAENDVHASSHDSKFTMRRDGRGWEVNIMSPLSSSLFLTMVVLPGPATDGGRRRCSSTNWPVTILSTTDLGTDAQSLPRVGEGQTSTSTH